MYRDQTEGQANWGPREGAMVDRFALLFHIKTQVYGRDEHFTIAVGDEAERNGRKREEPLEDDALRVYYREKGLEWRG